MASLRPAIRSGNLASLATILDAAVFNGKAFLNTKYTTLAPHASAGEVTKEKAHQIAPCFPFVYSLAPPARAGVVPFVLELFPAKYRRALFWCMIVKSFFCVSLKERHGLHTNFACPGARPCDSFPPARSC